MRIKVRFHVFPVTDVIHHHTKYNCLSCAYSWYIGDIWELSLDFQELIVRLYAYMRVYLSCFVHKQFWDLFPNVK